MEQIDFKRKKMFKMENLTRKTMKQGDTVGVITTQKLHFYKLKLNYIKHF